MQPAGHSPTQALSLTPMHGSVITYVMGAPTSLGDLPSAPGGLARAGLARWLGGLLATDVRHLHLRLHPLGAAGLAGAPLGVAVGPPRPDGADLLTQRLVAGACAQRAAQVVPGGGEQAGVELAVGRQPGAGAAAAKRLGDRGDHADLTGAVTVAVAAGDLPGVAWRGRLQRPLAADQRDDLRSGDGLFQPPAVGRADVHVLDEPQHVPAVPEMGCHR